MTLCCCCRTATSAPITVDAHGLRLVCSPLCAAITQALAIANMKQEARQ